MFYPCTPEGHADIVWKINLSIAKLRRLREPHEKLLLRHCETTGEIVQGRKAPPCRARWRVADVVHGEPKWEAVLEFDRK